MASTLTTTETLLQTFAREAPLRLQVRLEVPVPCPGVDHEIGLRFGGIGEEALPGVRNLPGQDDPRVVERHQVHRTSSRLRGVGPEAHQLVKREGRIGQDRQVHVPGAPGLGIGGGAEQEDQPYPRIP